MELPSTAVFDYPTAEGLSEMILSSLPPQPPTVIASQTQKADLTLDDSSAQPTSAPAEKAGTSGAFEAPNPDGEPQYFWSILVLSLPVLAILAIQN